MKKSDKLVFFLGGFLYLISRSIGLLLLPPFHDEVIYLWMGKQFAQSPVSNWAISLSDGKEPVFFWILGIFEKLFSPALLGGRLLSVFAGLVCLFIFFLICKKLAFSRKSTLIASFALIASPFVFFYERLALNDMLLTTFLTWALYQMVCFAKSPTIKTGIFLGLAISCSLLTKTNSVFFLLSMLPLGAFLVASKTSHPKFFWPMTAVLVTILLLTGWFFFSPSYHLISQKNKIFVLSFAEFAAHPFFLFYSNFKQAVRWLISYQGLPEIIILSFASLAFFLRKKILPLSISLMIVFPLIFESLIAKQFFPRYFLFVVIPMSLLLAVVLDNVKRRVLIMILAVPVFLPQIILISKLLTIPSKTPLHPTEKWQYVSGWPAGYGWKEASAYLSQFKDNKIVTEDIMGVPFFLTYFLGENKSSQIIKHDYDKDQNVESFFSSNKIKSAHFVFTQKQTIPQNWPLKLEKRFYRPGNSESISIWKYN